MGMYIINYTKLNSYTYSRENKNKKSNAFQKLNGLKVWNFAFLSCVETGHNICAQSFVWKEALWIFKVMYAEAVRESIHSPTVYIETLRTKKEQIACLGEGRICEFEMKIVKY